MGRVCNVSKLLNSWFFVSCFLLQFCTAIDSINQSQSIRDGQTLISAGDNFVLGFFSPANSRNRYLGIWYNKIPVQTVVWVANRETPITDSSSGILKIQNDGNLVVLDGNGSSVWSSNVASVSNSSTAKFLDTGNLVLSDGVSGIAIWQSFDHPSDSFLPGMKVGLNRITGTKQFLTSWESPENPSPGNFVLGVDNQGLAQLVLWEGNKRRWRSGPWNGRTFTGIPDMYHFYLNGFTLITDNEHGDLYFTFSIFNGTTKILNIIIDSVGMIKQMNWFEGSNDWSVPWSQPIKQCEFYDHCGPNAKCNDNDSPICSCLTGFEPKSPKDWAVGNWTGGCLRRTQLGCERNSSGSGKTREGDAFVRLKGVKIPDFSEWVAVDDLKSCESECVKNCSCVAFAFEAGIGCTVSAGELIDLQQFTKGGQELYLRLAASELGGKTKIMVIVIVLTLLGMLSTGLFIYYLWRWKLKPRVSRNKARNEDFLLFDLGKNAVATTDDSDTMKHGGREGKHSELPLFDLRTVLIATNNFSDVNKLGEGGFGLVYKGMLPDKQEIAVKRLSRSSFQGLEEFMNEVILISKLQHRNLVRLFGCCIQGEEKLLLYEYMPNKSLDAWLFDPRKGAVLDWKRRFNIVEGIARGLLYLHRDSRLRIIHRDLKASNILLDDWMNPKISDFGMARIFGGNQTQANTSKIVGTYGYMPPEYAMEGIFSEKSDVFSFGVLLLEIVSGKRNSRFYDLERSLNLLGYAWQLWNEDNWLQLVDPLLGNSFPEVEVLTCIRVALLCVQDGAINRPTMSSVIVMLDGENTTLPTPEQPAFYVNRRSQENPTVICCTNDLTVTLVDGR